MDCCSILFSAIKQVIPSYYFAARSAFEKTKFITQVKQTLKSKAIVSLSPQKVLKQKWKFLADSGSDAFGHKQLGGVAPVLAR